MGGSCSGVQPKRRVSLDSLFPIASVDLMHTAPGHCALASGQTLSEEEVSRAADDFQTLAKQFPEDKRLQLYLGISFFLSGFREAAITPLRAGIQGHDPDVVKGYYLLGTIYMAKNSLPAARSFLERGLGHNPNDLPLLLKLAELCLQERDYRAALDLAQRALAQQPNSAEAHSSAGQSLLSLGRTDEAIQELQISVAAHKSYKAYFSLGNAYRRKEQRFEAIACFQECVRLGERHFLHHFSLATLCLEEDLVLEALEHFRTGRVTGAQAEKLMQEKGFDLLLEPPALPAALELMYRGNTAAAEVDLRRIVEESRSAIACFYLGLLHARGDNLQAAQSALLQALLLFQGHTLKPMEEFFFTRASQEVKNLEAPMEENLALGEIDEEHSRGLIKELNAHSTPLSQSQSPDHSFSQGPGFKVRAESLENTRIPQRVRAPSPGDNEEEGRMQSPRGQHSSLRKFMPRVEASQADCTLS